MTSIKLLQKTSLNWDKFGLKIFCYSARNLKDEGKTTFKRDMTLQKLDIPTVCTVGQRANKNYNQMDITL